MNRRGFLYAGVVAAGRLLAEPLAGLARDTAAAGEWRNRQSSMAYRRLGRTGYMISEFVCGGNTISPANNDHVRLALDMGLNYLDTAPAYKDGESEKGLAAVMEGSSNRQRVFLATKVSPWDIHRNEVFQKMFESPGFQRLTGSGNSFRRLGLPFLANGNLLALVIWQPFFGGNMRFLWLLVLALFTLAALMTFQVAAKQEDAKKTGKACTYCHIKGNPKTLTEAGKYYKEKKSLEGYKETAEKK